MNESAWQEIEFSDEQYKSIWDRFYESFQFQPRYIAPGEPKLTGIVEPTPSATYNWEAALNEATSANPSVDTFLVLSNDLQSKAEIAFRQLVPQNGFIYALDWQHPAYRFYPHRVTAADKEKEWPITVLPDGDYYIFLAEDMSFGTFGHPWSGTICVFGQPLLDALVPLRPTAFSHLIRCDGKSVSS